MIQTLLFIVITNIITTISLPVGLSYDVGIMGAYFNTGDTNPVYGLRIDALDKNNNIIASSLIRESYTPPMTETIPIVLTSDAVKVRCEIFGPQLDKKWKDAYFTIQIVEPELNISLVNKNILVDWIDYGKIWQLEHKVNNGFWESTTNIIFPTIHQKEIFRLKRYFY